jgi:uncharacterized membrane protein YgaE (UPF0421/DUF939 family)
VLKLLQTPAIQLSVRAAAAAALAYWVAELLDADYAIYALVSAVIVTDLSPKKTRQLAVGRMAGTIIGAVAGALLVRVLPLGPIALAIAIVVSMLVASLFRLEVSATRVAGYVAAIVMMTHREDSWMYAFDRAWETLVGIGAAVLIGLLPLLLRGRPDPPEKV